MKKVEAYRVEIPITAKDEYSRELDKAEKAVKDVEKATGDSKKAQEDLAKSAKGVAKAHEGVSKSTKNASKSVEDVGKSAQQAEKQVRRTTKTFESFGNRIKSLQRAKANIQVSVKDGATRVLGRIQATWDSFRRNPITRITVSAVDRAMRILRGIKNTVLSIPTMITIGLSYVGIKSLSGATVGAAMNWEQYEVSMTHWLDGNIKQAKELTKWMGEHADSTPFSSPELFPALTRAVSITDRDIDKSKRLLRIASDMAALTPDRSVEDAMQAIANSKMGNTVMLQGFGLDISKKELDEMGGYEILLDVLEKKFKDGAVKLSKTASGVIATLKGYRSSLMRSIGTGFLEPMKVRLDRVNMWLADNQDTWGRWKDTVKDAGEQFSEFAFSKAERAFKYLSGIFTPRTGDMWGPALEDAGIDPNMSFTAKLGIVFDDTKGAIGSWWSSSAKPAIHEWWDETGSGVALEIGKSIGSGIMEGIKLGLGGGKDLLLGSWSQYFDDVQGEGLFSREASSSLLMAGATTLGAGYLGKKIFYNPAKSVFRGGKKVKGWLDKSPERQAQRTKKWNESNDKRTERRMRRGDKAAEKKALKKMKIPKNSSKLLKGAPILRPLLAGLSLFEASEEELPGVIGSIAGGLVGAKGGAMAGAAIGSVVPGVGTAIGGTVGGILGGIGGAFGGEWIGNHWDTIKEKAVDVKDAIANTLFSGEWWSSKWESVTSFATSTFLNGGWWAERAGFIWGSLENSLFSGEWWMSKWDAVKGWTSDKWGEWNEVYDNAKTKIDETIFSGEWWGGKWDGVKSWTSNKWDEFTSIWEGAKTAISNSLFSAEWWSGKWGQVKSWASSAWSSITSGFQVGRNKANNKGGGNVTAYARGGIARRPHLGLVAEAGVPEAMIPWDGSSRSKALWQQTGEALGMFEGGPSQSSGDAKVASSAGVSLNIGDIHVGGGNNMSAEEILSLITPALYEKIKAAIAKR